MKDTNITQNGYGGDIRLTRPQALNALSHRMCRIIAQILVQWRNDSDIRFIIISSDVPKAFCAGGDVAALYHAAQAGNERALPQYWRDEYHLNACIARYPKPVISWINGYCMGGGVGLACHAHMRIVGESARIAMPECAIGLVPDVGGSALLARAGAMGRYLGTTGAMMGPHDAIEAGFADYFVPEAHWPDLIKHLGETGDTTLIKQAAQTPDKGLLAQHHTEINHLFDPINPCDIFTRLTNRDSPFARDTFKKLADLSPLSLCVTLKMLGNLGQNPNIETALAQEYRATFRAVSHLDFIEGVRAKLIDKDHRPHWRHPSIQDVMPDEVDAILAPLGAHELFTPA